MPVNKYYTNKSKTKFKWSFVVDVPSGEYDKFGKQKRKQVRVRGFNTEKEAKEAERKFLNSLDDADLEYILDILDDGVHTPKRMKLIYNEYVESFDTGSKGYVVECPYCCRQFNEENERDFNYCPKCGQAIEW